MPSLSDHTRTELNRSGSSLHRIYTLQQKVSPAPRKFSAIFPHRLRILNKYRVRQKVPPPKIFGNISPSAENFKYIQGAAEIVPPEISGTIINQSLRILNEILYAQCILRSYLCEITKFQSISFNCDNTVSRSSSEFLHFV